MQAKAPLRLKSITRSAIHQDKPKLMKLLSVQALRGIAAMMVALYHLFLNEQAGLSAAGAEESSALLDLTRNGLAGVDLFFVISGFIMVYVTADRPRGRLGTTDFLLARISRIYPLWWAFSLGFMALIFLGTGSLTPPAYDIPDEQTFSYLLQSFALWPQADLPYIVVGWTLIHEMYFYAVFAAFLLAPQRLLAPFLGGWLGLVVLGNLVGPASPSNATDLPSLIFHPLTIEFIAGAGIGLLIQRGVRALALPALLIGAITLFSTVFFLQLESAGLDGSWLRVLVFGLPSVLMLYGFVALEIMGRVTIAKPFVYLGDISYALYLGHLIAFFLALQIFEIGPLKLGAAGPLDNIAFAITGLVGAIAAAVIAHHLIENPSLNWLAAQRKRMIRREAAGRDA